MRPRVRTFDGLFGRRPQGNPLGLVLSNFVRAGTTAALPSRPIRIGRVASWYGGEPVGVHRINSLDGQR